MESSSQQDQFWGQDNRVFQTNTDARPLRALGKNYDEIEGGDTCRSIASRNNLSLLDL
jgi:hypothetical protein